MNIFMYLISKDRDQSVSGANFAAVRLQVCFVCVCAYVCESVWMYICIYVCIYMYICIYIYIYISYL